MQFCVCVCVRVCSELWVKGLGSSQCCLTANSTRFSFLIRSKSGSIGAWRSSASNHGTSQRVQIRKQYILSPKVPTL